MKEIKAIVQPLMLAHVVHALKEMPGLPGVTVSEVRGFGKSRAEGAQERVVEDSIGYAKKAKIEIVVPEDLVEPVLATIEKHARTGRPSDGKIFVSSVEEVVKIRSGERGGKAI